MRKRQKKAFILRGPLFTTIEINLLNFIPKKLNNITVFFTTFAASNTIKNVRKTTYFLQWFNATKMMRKRHYLSLIFLLFYLQNIAQNAYFFEPIRAINGLPHQTVYRVLQDKKGFMWFGTQRGLMRYDGYTCRLFGQTQAGTEGILGKPIHALLEDKQGNIWVCTHTGDLCKQDFLTGKFQYLTDTFSLKTLINKRIQTIFEDNIGQIWLGTLDDGLLILDPKTNKIQHFNQANSGLSNNAVFAFAQDKTGRIWVATSGEGINYFDPEPQKFKQRYADVPNFNGYQKTLLLEGNNLWIGSDGTGLYQLNLTTNSIKHFGAQNDGKSINSNAVLGLALNKNKELLIATDGGGLNVFNTELNTFKYYKNDNKNNGSLNTNALYDVCVDASNNVWVATFNGGVNLQKAHQNRFDFFSYTGNKTNELNNRSVLGLCQTANGSILIGTDGGGLNLFNRQNNNFAAINNPNKIQNNVVKTIYEDPQKRVWLGYFKGGLALYNPQNQTFKHYLSNPSDSFSISNNSVWSIASDASGDLWVGTVGNGVNLFNPQTEKFQRFNSHNNDPTSLSNDGIMVVFVDKQNRVWIGTEHSGLNLFNREKSNFTHFQHDKKGPLSISSDFIRSIFEDSRGRLWIGTEGGGLNQYVGDGKFKHFTTQNGLISDAIMGITEDLTGHLWLNSYEGIARFDTDRDSFQNFKFNKTLDNRGNQFNQSAILRINNGELLFGGINGLNIINPELITPNAVKPRVVFTDFKVFDASIINGELDGRQIFDGDINNKPKINLSYKDNAFSIEFAALDFTESSRNQYAFKLDGFDKEWHYNAAEQRRVTYTNLDAGTYIFHVRGTNSGGEWSDNEAVMTIVVAPPFWATWWFKLFIFLTFIGLSVVAFRIYLMRREMELKQRVMESEQEILSLNNQQLASEQAILSLQNEKLTTEIDTKNNELMSKAVQMAHKNELLLGIKDDLETIKTATETERLKSLRNLTRTLESEIENKESWDQFLLYFNQTHQNFIHELQTKHPNLTQNDLRMCALTRLNMSNREMATLLNISITGIEKSRYRLKKRLDLTVEDDLSRYLTAF
jgi:ligand-binding sensor domain-containing protein/DNA-binding CsgD family transcriptional regulator